MLLKFEGDIAGLERGIAIMSERLGFCVGDNGIPVKVQKGTGKLEVSMEEDKGCIVYSEKVQFFRALGLLLEGLQSSTSFKIVEEPQFTLNGGMFDLSRNAVLKVESIKNLLEKMALMGLNMVMLYTEDTYTIEGEPYFGYMRGRYSYEELKEVDDYADIFGIEMIPCIQTLAHLQQFLRWPAARYLRDTADVLLAETESTYEFIDRMIRAASAPFRSKRIHVGMDEAHGLGLGRYLEKYGYKRRFDIMTNHLNRVLEICRKYGLKPMMWSDMFFRLASKTGHYYDMNADIPKDVIEKVPREVQLVYWDYYHHEQKEYEFFISKHKEFGTDPVFAGGIWTWTGMCTNYGVTFLNTNAALNACKKGGIKEVFATMWGDDGAENNLFTTLLGLQLFAEHGYSKELDMEKLKRRVKFCTGLDFDAFMDLKYLDETPGTLPDNRECNNPSKFLLWQDVLIGLFDKHVESLDMAGHYAATEEKIRSHRDPSKELDFIFEVPQKLCSVLRIKADMGIRIKKAYDSKDLDTLKKIAREELPELSRRVNELRIAHRDQWLRIYKPFGWEIIDIRYGGVMARIDTAIKRLEDYILGRIDRIEELEEERLYYDNRKTQINEEGLTYAMYTWAASANVFSHG